MFLRFILVGWYVTFIYGHSRIIGLLMAMPQLSCLLSLEIGLLLLFSVTSNAAINILTHGPMQEFL